MSSSTTLWATASKEWVIPSKPKPGRKPKKDPPVASVSGQDDEADAKGRRIQNRAAQRAFRERKQSQLAELQARILSYEQGEIERNVALQKIAKRLKEENERLVQENAALKERLTKAEQKDKVVESDKKRPREDSPKAMSQAKRPKASASPDAVMEPPADSPAPSSTLSPESISTPSDDMDLSYSNQYDVNTSALTTMLDFSSTIKGDTVNPFPPFDCGFSCSESTPCVCRDMLNSFKADSFVDPTSLVSFEPTPPPLTATPSQQPSPSTSVLDNLPAYQPPVPLRRRTNKPPVKPIFPIFSVSSDSEGQNGVKGPACSGDPNNCEACRDDSFGKAFCSAIEESVMSQGTCENCPGRQLDGSGGCCGIPNLCSGCPLAPMQTNSPEHQHYIPTNQAWQQIKEHPNVEFADLALLAEVVASRSKCSGPRIIMSPAPDGQKWNQDRVPFSATATSGQARAPPQLVPQEVLLECGRRRVREVHSDAVRDALRLLDAKFT